MKRLTIAVVIITIIGMIVVSVALSLLPSFQGTTTAPPSTKTIIITTTTTETTTTTSTAAITATTTQVSTSVVTERVTTTSTTSIALNTTSTTSITSSKSECPPLVGCGPYPILAIHGAGAQVGSFEPTGCQTTNYTANCVVYIVGGDSGKVMVNVTLQGVRPGTYVGGAHVAFLVYSSAARYVNFTSIPTCAYTSGPSYDVEGCQIPPNGQVEFQFAFSVSPSYGTSNQRWPDSITIYMWQTCCLP